MKHKDITDHALLPQPSSPGELVRVDATYARRAVCPPVCRNTKRSSGSTRPFLIQSIMPAATLDVYVGSSTRPSSAPKRFVAATDEGVGTTYPTPTWSSTVISVTELRSGSHCSRDAPPPGEH